MRNLSSFRPRLEALEDRLTPVTNTWLGTADGFWGTAGNWSGGHVPTATEDVIFSSASNVGCSAAWYSAYAVTPCRSITINTAYTQQIALSVFNNFAMPGGQLYVHDLVMEDAFGGANANLELGGGTGLTVDLWTWRGGSINVQNRLSTAESITVAANGAAAWDGHPCYIGADVIMSSGSTLSIDTTSNVTWCLQGGLTNYGTVTHKSADFLIATGTAKDTYTGAISNYGSYTVSTVSNQNEPVVSELPFLNLASAASLKVDDALFNLKNPGSRDAVLVQTDGKVSLTNAAVLKGWGGITKEDLRINGGLFEVLGGTAYVSDANLRLSNYAELKLGTATPNAAAGLVLNLDLSLNDHAKVTMRVIGGVALDSWDTIVARDVFITGSFVTAAVDTVNVPRAGKSFSLITASSTNAISGAFGIVTLGNGLVGNENYNYGASWEVTS